MVLECCILGSSGVDSRRISEVCRLQLAGLGLLVGFAGIVAVGLWSDMSIVVEVGNMVLWGTLHWGALLVDLSCFLVQVSALLVCCCMNYVMALMWDL